MHGGKEPLPTTAILQQRLSVTEREKVKRVGAPKSKADGRMDRPCGFEEDRRHEARNRKKKKKRLGRVGSCKPGPKGSP